MPRFFIHTFGCQMNEHDSTRMGESLARAGWTPTGEAESADLVLLNTCAIREKAEDKLYSALGRYRLLKAQRGTKIGVSGCVAQLAKDDITARARYVDFVLGPDQLGRLPELASRPSAMNHRAGEAPVETAWVPSEEYLFPQAEAESSRGRATAFVTAMKGCDNVCSFCVVPFTRGREVSRPYAEIIREIESLCLVGVREVALLGQNVNAYTGGCTFAELLRRVDAVPGLARLRFTTSHPMDLSDELVACFAPEAQGGVRSLMPHFHLPVQHGSDAVLSRMRRTYTVAEYERRAGKLLELQPQLALTSDLICGFPGETEADHALTLKLLERIPYDSLYSFLYSRRPHTTADKLLLRNEAAPVQDPAWAEVPRELALHRLDEIQALQRARTEARHAALVGHEVEVLVEEVKSEEGAPPERAGERFGRSRENWAVHFQGASRVGDLVRVHIDSSSLVALRGTQASVVQASPAPKPLPVSVPTPGRRKLQLSIVEGR